jgi:hypothetical protein
MLLCQQLARVQERYLKFFWNKALYSTTRQFDSVNELGPNEL